MGEFASEVLASRLAIEGAGGASRDVAPALAAQAADRRREMAALRGEVGAARAQLGELVVMLERMQQQLRQLDRDALRAEERDRELLDALDDARQRDEQLYAAVARLREPRGRWWRRRRRARGC